MLVLAILMAVAQVEMAAAQTAPKFADALPPGYLHTDGNQIVSADGQPVRLSCVGYFHPRDIARDIPAMAAAGFNCVRFPWFNGTLQANLATADKIVAAASEVGLKVILDHHGDETPSHLNGWLPFPCNGLPIDLGPGTDGQDGCGDVGTVDRQRFIADWVIVARHFAGNPTVIGMDLTNEPHLAPWYWRKNPGGATWGDGSPTDIRLLYEQAGNAIEAADPGVLIIAQGVIDFRRVMFDGTKNLIKGSTDLTLAAAQPVQLDSPHHVVYSVHDYPTIIATTKPDHGPIKLLSMELCWGYLETRNIAPVWVGEMGASLDHEGGDSAAHLADEQAWATTLVSFLNGEDGALGGPEFSGRQKGIGTDWWAWGYFPGSRPNPDGTLDENGHLRPAQAAVYSLLR